MKNNEFTTCSEMIMKVFNNIGYNSDNSKLINSWKKILLSIKGYGENQRIGQNLFDHSKIEEIKNNIMLIEVDHPGWIQMFKMYNKYILNGLRMFIPEMQITSIAYKLKGSNAKLCNVNYDEELKKENELSKEKLKKSEEILKKYEKNGDNLSTKNELPEDIKNIFENMINKSDIDEY